MHGMNSYLFYANKHALNYVRMVFWGRWESRIFPRLWLLQLNCLCSWALVENAIAWMSNSRSGPCVLAFTLNEIITLILLFQNWYNFSSKLFKL